MFSNFNMKRLVIWLIIIMSVSFAIAASIFVVYEAKDFAWNWSPNSSSYSDNLDQEKTFSAAGIKDIYANTVGADVNFILTDGQEVKAHLYGKVSSSRKSTVTELYTDLQGSKLTIEEKNKFHLINIGNYRSDLKLDIYIPKTYAENIRVNTVSGDLKISDINLATFSFKSVSGGLESASLLTKDTVLDTVSGNFRIDVFSGDLSFNSISGDLNAAYKSFADNVRTNTISGDTNIKLPENSEFDLRSKSVSGDVACDFPIVLTGSGKQHDMEGTVGKGGHEIRTESVSGDVRISK